LTLINNFFINLKKVQLYFRIFTNLYKLKKFSFEKISDHVDDLLERVSLNIDIMKGIKKDKSKADVENELSEIKQSYDLKFSHSNSQYIKDQTNRSIANSDVDLFDIDNTYYPFIPKIYSKPNAITPLNPGIAEARETRKMNADTIRQINFKDRKAREFDENKRLFAHPYGDEIRGFFNNFSDRFEKINNLLSPSKDKLKFIKIKIFDMLQLNTMGDVNSNFFAIKNQLKKLDLEQKYSAIEKYNSVQRKILNSENKNVKLTLDDFKNKEALNDAKNNNNEDLIPFYEIEYLNLDLTNLIYVDTPEFLGEMIKEISKYSTEIAVDLEHHQKESFLGITCLIQISTRFNDYIIDAIKLRSHLQDLNKIFTDPKIVKVLHGSDFDVLWLQKDFGVYIVNMFDTGQAARVLNFTSFSLAYLLTSICGVNPDKKYQLADWRVRPLPEEMLKYAREDTHYLLYCYDVLKSQLIKKSLMRSESILYNIALNYKKSCDLTLKEFIKPSVKETEYYQMKSQSVSSLNKKQFSIFKLLYKFRDYIARKLDYSTNFILNNKLLSQISKAFDYNNPTNFKNSILEIVYNKENNGKYGLFIKHLNDLFVHVNEKIESLKNKKDNKDFKQLENNYLDNMKKNFYNVSTNKNIKIANANQALNIFDTNKKDTANADSKDSNNKGFNLKVLASNFEIKDLKIKEDIRLPFTTQGMKSNLSFKTRESFPSINYKNEYNSVIKKFENFNLISFLQEGKANLQIKIKTIDKKEEPKTDAIKVSNTSEVQLGEKVQFVKESNNIKNTKKPDIYNVSSNAKVEEKLEKFLQMKRKQEMIDLTDYNINGNARSNKNIDNQGKFANKNYKKNKDLSLHSSDDINESESESEPDVLEFVNKRKGLINNDLNLKSEIIKGNFQSYIYYLFSLFILIFLDKLQTYEHLVDEHKKLNSKFKKKK